MKHWQTLTLACAVATSLAACSSGGGDSNDRPVDDDQVGTTGGTAGTATGGTAGDTTGGTSGGTTGTATGGTGTGSGGTVTGGTATGGTATGGTGTGGTGTGGTDTGGTGTGGTGTGGTGTGGTGGTGGLPTADVIETLENDPYGFTLETAVGPATGDGSPTQPQNLRIDLISNDWAEIDWAPSQDADGTVAAYRIDRDDGQAFLIRPALEPGLALDAGTYREYEKYWNTTSFIDCNSTRFGFAPGSDKAADGPWNCADVAPSPGSSHTYMVTAIDNVGNESQASEPLTVSYLPNDAAALSKVDDFLGDFDLVWNDEFEGNALDPANWQTSLRGGPETFINGEQQYFVHTLETPVVDYDPFGFDGENLTISAIETPAAMRAQLPAGCDVEDPVLANDPERERCEFLSGALSTHDRMQFVYGYVEGRIRASTVSGALGSFYLLNRYPGENKPEEGLYQRHSPEIDILEYLGENPFGAPDAFQTYHYNDVSRDVTRSSPTMNHAKEDGGIYGGEFHTFGVLWEPQLVIWYIDGVEIRRLTGPQVSRQPMNIINYLVAGSGWAPEPVKDGTALTMDIDYMRVYQREQFQGSLSVGSP